MFAIKKTSLTMLFLGFLDSAQGRPNVIIMQPDDLPFLDEWTAPPNNPTDPTGPNPIPYNDGNGMQHIDSLRLNGLQMMQAYAASPVCGTSRYSTITGKMPSRAASVRDWAEDNTNDPAVVTIPTTKLQDIDGQNDCSEENVANQFKNAEYRTGMFGKWHMSSIEDNDYSYDSAVDIVKGCGFTYVGGLYVENLNGHFNNDGSFSHNMEWLTYEAIKFINETVAAEEEFFMYFNPTVPHSSGDVVAAITSFDCTDIADPNFVWDSDPWIKGMTEDGCAAYRGSIIQRSLETADMGKIWLDDSVGALLEALRDNGVLDDTIFLFQEDHGMDSKKTLYEGGIRIPQFVHYPNGITAGTTFDGLVSTIDIAATMMDFAEIVPNYDLDGKSWKDAIGNPSEEAYWKNERCLFFETDQDRAVRCGCYKYVEIFEKGNRDGQSNIIGGDLFDLCGGTSDYITAMANNQEENVVTNNAKETHLTAALDCHLDATDPDQSPLYSVCPQICRDSPLNTFVQNTARDCAWVSNTNNNASMCTQRKYSSHCQASCDVCDNCEDARARFEYNDQQLRCSTHATDALCEDEDFARTCPSSCGMCW